MKTSDYKSHLSTMLKNEEELLKIYITYRNKFSSSQNSMNYYDSLISSTRKNIFCLKKSLKISNLIDNL